MSEKLNKLPAYKKAKTESLIPYAMNSRTHSEEQVNQIAASIAEFGFTNPILIDEHNSIIAGHGRLLAAKKLGINEVPTITITGLSEAQKKAYVIADNQLALNAGWDFELLNLEIEHLKECDFNIDLLGFSDSFLNPPEPKEPTQPEGQEYNEVFEVVVGCRDEAEQEAIFQMMTARGLKCRVLSM